MIKPDNYSEYYRCWPSIIHVSLIGKVDFIEEDDGWETIEVYDLNWEFFGSNSYDGKDNIAMDEVDNLIDSILFYEDMENLDNEELDEDNLYEDEDRVCNNVDCPICIDQNKKV